VEWVWSLVVAEDCFGVGRQAYAESQWKLAGDWMREALNKYDEEGKDHQHSVPGTLPVFHRMEHSNVAVWLLGAGRGSDLDLALVYDHLSYAEYKLGNLKKAAQYTRDLLQNGKGSTEQRGVC